MAMEHKAMEKNTTDIMETKIILFSCPANESNN
jgi:hypothetical protein